MRGRKAYDFRQDGSRAVGRGDFATVTMTHRSTGGRRYWRTAREAAQAARGAFRVGGAAYVEIQHQGRYLVTLERRGRLFESEAVVDELEAEIQAAFGVRSD